MYKILQKNVAFSKKTLYFRANPNIIGVICWKLYFLKGIKSWENILEQMAFVVRLIKY